MGKNLSFLLGFIVLILAGCSTADQKVPQMATDFCNCFTDIQKNMSDKTKAIMAKAANSSSPEATLTTELQSLPEDEKMTVAEEMMSMGEMQDKNSKMGRCMSDVEKKYGNAKTFDQKKFLKKLVKELESKPGCDVTATIVKLGMKEKDMD